MRTAAETLQERAPEELTIDNIERELIQNLHMKQENAASWVTAVRAHFASVSSVLRSFFGIVNVLTCIVIVSYMYRPGIGCCLTDMYR